MKYFIFSLFISVFATGFGQDHGFFGKKNIISFSATGAVPIINLIVSQINQESALYRESAGSLKPANNLFDGGFNASFVHGFSNDFGFGIEYAMNFSNCSGPVNMEVPSDVGYSNFYTIQHEMLDLTTMTFMPKIEFTANSNIISVGLHSEFGIGYSLTTVKEKDYLSEVQYYYNEADIPYYNQSKVFNQKDKYHSLAILYGLSVRVPISKSFLFHCGVRYSFNLNSNLLLDEFTPGNSSQYNKGYYTSKEDIANNVARSRFLSIVTGNIGLAFMF